MNETLIWKPTKLLNNKGELVARKRRERHDVKHSRSQPFISFWLWVLKCNENRVSIVAICSPTSDTLHQQVARQNQNYVCLISFDVVHYVWHPRSTDKQQKQLRRRWTPRNTKRSIIIMIIFRFVPNMSALWIYMENVASTFHRHSRRHATCRHQRHRRRCSLHFSLPLVSLLFALFSGPTVFLLFIFSAHSHTAHTFGLVIKQNVRSRKKKQQTMTRG